MAIEVVLWERRLAQRALCSVRSPLLLLAQHFILRAGACREGGCEKSRCWQRWWTRWLQTTPVRCVAAAHLLDLAPAGLYGVVGAVFPLVRRCHLRINGAGAGRLLQCASQRVGAGWGRGWAAAPLLASSRRRCTPWWRLRGQDKCCWHLLEALGGCWRAAGWEGVGRGGMQASASG